MQTDKKQFRASVLIAGVIIGEDCLYAADRFVACECLGGLSWNGANRPDLRARS